MSYLVIGLGGFCGAILRYWIGTRTQSIFPGSAFPYGTFVVNIIGCFAIGAFAYLVEARGSIGPHVRLFVAVGLLGGFTTFSAFANETLAALRTGAVLVAIANVMLSVGLGLLAAWAGRAAIAAVLR